MQRRILVSVALAALLATSGCSGLLGGPVTFSASPATVNDNALNQTDYSLESIDNQTVSRNVSAAGETKEVEVTNVVANYHRTVDLGPLGEREAAVFTAFSSPQIDVLGQQFNPLENYDNHDLVMLLQSQYESVSDIQNVSSSERTVLGQQTVVSKYSAQATFEDGSSTDVYIVLTKVKHGDDYVVGVGVYPQQLDGEDQRISTLLDGLQHATNS